MDENESDLLFYNCGIIIHSEVYGKPKIYLSSSEEPIVIYDCALEYVTKCYPYPHQRSEITYHHEGYSYYPHIKILNLRIVDKKIKFMTLYIQKRNYIIKTNGYNIIDLEKNKIKYRQKIIPLMYMRTQNQVPEAYTMWKEFDTKVAVLAGGSMFTVALVGAVSKLRFLLDKVILWCCTSGGAILGMLYLLGFTDEEMLDAMMNMNFTECMPEHSSKLMMVINFIQNGSLNDGQKIIENKLRSMIKAKINQDTITFRELYHRYKKVLIMTTVNISVSKTWYLSIATTPDLDIIKAAMMSSALPLMWPAREYNNHLFIDGGVCDNFPISEGLNYSKYMAVASWLDVNKDECKGKLHEIFISTLNVPINESIIGIRSSRTLSTFQDKTSIQSSPIEYIKAIGKVIGNSNTLISDSLSNILTIPIYSTVDNSFQMTKENLLNIYEEGQYYTKEFIIGLHKTVKAK